MTWNLTRPLGSGQGLTLVLGLPKGVITEPTALQKFLDRASDYFSGWFLVPLGVFGFIFHRWRTQGRDPAGRAAIEPRYAPPEGLTPAEVGASLIAGLRAGRDTVAPGPAALALRLHRWAPGILRRAVLHQA